MQDFAYFKSLYPAECKKMQLCVEAVCDEMEYEGSPIYDEYPDRILLDTLSRRAEKKWQDQEETSLKAEELAGQPEEKQPNLRIQPHLPGNDVWYGPVRGEQQGKNAGYTVWEAEEENLTAQERRPWSPPPGPRPGNPGNPWGPPPPPPGPRPGNPGNPWGPPPPPPGPRPGNPGNPWGPPPPPPGPRPGNPGSPWGAPPPPPGTRPDGGNCGLMGCGTKQKTPLQDFFQVLLMNELQERRRCHTGCR